MDHLRMRMFYPDPAVSDFATVAPFFVRFLDELRFQDASPVLFNTFVGDDIFVSACATAMATAPNDAQKEAAAMVLEKLIKTSREVIAPVPQPEGSPPQPPPTNHLSAITAELTQRIVGALGPIQDTLLDRAWEGGSRKYSAYTVVSGLGAVRYFAVSVRVAARFVIFAWLGLAWLGLAWLGFVFGLGGFRTGSLLCKGEPRGVG